MPKQSQIVTLDSSSPSFQTAAAAADAVSKSFAQQKDTEQAAVVIKRPDGTYGYSTVAPQETHDSFALRAQFPKDHVLAGIVHSHPGTDALGQVFSPQDLQVAETLKVPSYIRFVNDNTIRQYVPGTTKTQNTQVAGNKFGVRSAVGDPIEQEPISPPPPPSSASTIAAPSSPLSMVVRRDDSVTQY